MLQWSALRRAAFANPVEMPMYEIIDDAAGVARATQQLAGSSRLFLDTEFESTRHGTTLCLLQLSAGEVVYLFDPLSCGSLEPLAAVLGAPGAEWVLHSGQQDVPLLMDAVKLRARPRVFDTQVAWALLGAEFSVSLAYLVFRVLGIRSLKAHQADDWKRRPLPVGQLEYAAKDVVHLPPLFDELQRQAAALGRSETIFAATAEQLWPPPKDVGAPRLSSFRGAWQLDAEGQAALRFLVDWYEALEGDDRRHAPEGKTLLQIASRRPTSADQLARIKGVSARWCQRRGPGLVRGLTQAVRGAVNEDFEPIEPAPYATFEAIRLDAWLQLLRAHVCESERLAPELVLPARLLKGWTTELVEGQPMRQVLGSLKGWRAELLEQPLLDAIERVPCPQPAR